MLQRTYLLTLLALFPIGEIDAGTLLINSQDQWLQWTFPQGVLSLAADGSVELRHFRRDIDAVADAAEFFHLNAKGKEVQGGIRSAGTHIDQAAHILDGAATTWWQPSQEAPLDDWWVEIDLGRLVQAKKIRLTFPDTEGARPLREFSVFVTEGTPFLTGQDVFRYDRVGGTTQPSQETVIEYDLVTPELGNATGEHLATSDTLEYMSIQYVRVVAHAKSLDAALAVVEVEAIGDNIAPGTIERGGVIRTGRDPRTIANIMDGTAATWWTLTSRGDLDWRDKGDWFEWDLGATFWIDQLTMVEPPPGFATLGVNSYRNQSGFELLTSDGTPIPTQGEERLQSPVDYQLLSFVDNETLSSAGTRNRNFDFRFPARKVRYLFYHHESPVNRSTVFHLFEIFLYGAGHPAEVVMTSNFIDLAGAKSLRRMRWEAETTDETRIELRTRTGNTLDEEIFYYDKNGREVPKGRWDKLPASQKLPEVIVTKAGADWSAWSSAYKEPGEAFRSPTPRRFVQMEVRLQTADPEVAPTLREIALDFDDPLIGGGVFASVAPREAVLDSLTVFTFRLGGRTRPTDRGFNRLLFDLPNPLEGGVQLRIGDRRVEPLQVEASGDSVVIDLPEQVRGDSIEVELPLRLLANAAAFDAWVSSTTQPDIRQGIQPEDLGALTVFVPEIAQEEHLIRALDVTSEIVTPNGDGINDRLQLRLLVVKTTAQPKVAIYDLSGALVASINQVDQTHYLWDGRDESGLLLPPGIYILDAKVETDTTTERRQRVVHLVY